VIDVFAVQLRWFPSSGLSSLGREHDTLDRFGTSPLRCLAIALVSFVSWMRYQRSSIIEPMSSAYIRTARSKGLSEREVLFRQVPSGSHCCRS